MERDIKLSQLYLRGSPMRALITGLFIKSSRASSQIKQTALSCVQRADGRHVSAFMQIKAIWRLTLFKSALLRVKTYTLSGVNDAYRNLNFKHINLMKAFLHFTNIAQT